MEVTKAAARSRSAANASRGCGCGDEAPGERGGGVFGRVCAPPCNSPASAGSLGRPYPPAVPPREPPPLEAEARLPAWLFAPLVGALAILEDASGRSA